MSDDDDATFDENEDEAESKWLGPAAAVRLDSTLAAHTRVRKRGKVS